MVKSSSKKNECSKLLMRGDRTRLYLWRDLEKLATPPGSVPDHCRIDRSPQGIELLVARNPKFKSKGERRLFLYF